MSGFTHVYTGETLVDASMAEDWLRQHGVPVEMTNRYLSGAIGELPPGPSSSPQILVRNDQAEYARKLLEQWRNNRDADSDHHWTCRHCGAPGEPGFHACWRCDRPRGE